MDGISRHTVLGIPKSNKKWKVQTGLNRILILHSVASQPFCQPANYSTTNSFMIHYCPTSSCSLHHLASVNQPYLFVQPSPQICIPSLTVCWGANHLCTRTIMNATENGVAKTLQSLVSGQGKVMIAQFQGKPLTISTIYQFLRSPSHDFAPKASESECARCTNLVWQCHLELVKKLDRHEKLLQQLPFATKTFWWG
jgi:hypothetical protein